MADGFVQPEFSLRDLLRFFRIRSGFSQEQLAERAGISAAAIAAIEQGIRTAPYAHTVARLSLALNLSDAERSTLVALAQRPRLRTAALPAAARSDNSPRALTSFVDRMEVGEIENLLERFRCVTITGAGGIGKTRTAIEVAKRFGGRRNVRFVDLSAIRDEQAIPSHVAAAVGARVAGRESDDTITALVEAVADGPLVVLDNCEHISAGVAGLVHALFTANRSVRVIATSREPLGLMSEYVFRLPTLRVPDDRLISLESANAFAAVTLFLERARSADVNFRAGSDDLPSIIDICHKVDGLPLAIELAVARLATFGLATLNARLNDVLAIPGFVDFPARHRTLDIMIAWSFDLLSDLEQRFFIRVSLLASAFTVKAATVVCADLDLDEIGVIAVLTRLVEKSLIAVSSNGTGTQYALLDSIRTFGQSRLRASGEFDQTSLRYATWLADEIDTIRSSKAEALVELMPDIDCTCAAVEWCLSTGEQRHILLAARIVTGASPLWAAKGRFIQQRKYLIEIIERLDRSDENAALIGRLWKARIDSFPDQNRERIDEATPFLERAGQLAAVATINAQLALTEAREGEFARAWDSYRKAIAYFDAGEGRRTGAHYQFVVSVGAWIRFAQNDFEQARIDLERLLAEMDMQGASIEQRADALQLLAEVEDALGDTQAAIVTAKKALDCYGASSSSSSIAITMSNLCGYLLRSGDDLGEAHRYGEQSLRMLAEAQESGANWDALLAAQNLAAVNAVIGNVVPAAVMLGFIDAEYARASHKLSATDQASHDLLAACVQADLPAGEAETLRAQGAQLDFVRATEFILRTSGSIA